MSATVTESPLFEPGATGWIASDLDDPDIEQQWFDGRYEIIEGVLTKLAPAYFAGGKALQKLIFRVVTHIGEEIGSFAPEAEIIIDEARVVRADAAFLTPSDEKRQREAALAAGRKDPERTRILIPPTLVVESVNPGHELHDKRTKRKWYAEFGIANYWSVDRFRRSLKCMILRNGSYEDDAVGHGDDEVRPSLFSGLVLTLKQIWES